jgi:hypothetical protein
MSTAQQQQSVKTDDLGAAESRGSLTPLLPGAFPASSKSSAEPEMSEASPADPESAPKSSRRSFWKLGKRSEEDKPKDKVQFVAAPKAAVTHLPPVAALRPISPFRAPDAARGASPQSQPNDSAVSPGPGLYSSSPRLHSPASSQIFERNVQEEVLPAQASPHLPSHIITENYIPPALDASSAAITDEKLDPDDVEIVTSSTHLPASVTLTGAGPEQSMSSSFHDDFSHNHRHALNEDNASNYGTLDSPDVRRLSFVSFADVVHAEHAEHTDSMDSISHRGSMQFSGMTGHPSLTAPRSPSPMRSPMSSHGVGTSPPTSVSASVKGLETSPNRGLRGPGSPLSAQSPPHSGELSVETMRQALRRTGSGDLNGARSQPMSAIGNDDGAFTDRPFK